MATITLNYDAHNPNVKMLLNSIVNLGLATVENSRKTGIELALEDIAKGKVYRVHTPQKRDADSI
ncbi:MAG: hypothetical protein LBB73_08930 [Dysgonamonadaceae bacterium]|jgi:hypothetical protein|nr:hypothetical protein [Dysgonamonadaceae bacterium]